MEQHPIPQQISSYQFKLVGDMTLKQFFQVAGGVIISLIFYSTSLYPIIKWPLIIFFSGLGVAMAFLPIEERPLSRWIIAFFKSIYSPTLYIWEKTDKPTVFYTENASTPEINSIPNNQIVEGDVVKLENAEKSFLSKVSGMWGTTSMPSVKVQQTAAAAIPQKAMPASFSQTTQTPSVPKPANTDFSSTVPLPTPQQMPTVITKSAPKLVVEESQSHQNTAPVAPPSTLAFKESEDKPITSNSVEFSVDAAPPSPPIAINTIVGQVIDQNRKIIEGAILEIKDSSGRPVRALKSNKAGHFIIVTPLSNGRYEISIEKDGFTFESVSFEARGEMISPMAIKGVKI